jgi:hypothetical protein
LDQLIEYAEPFVAEWFPALPEVGKKQYLALKSKYDLFGMLMLSFGPYGLITQKGGIPTLPLIKRLTPDPLLKTIPKEILEETAYREFLEACLKHGQGAIEEFSEIRDRNIS